MARSRSRLVERTSLRASAVPALCSELSTLIGPHLACRRNQAPFSEAAAACAAQGISGPGAWGPTHRYARGQSRANSEDVRVGVLSLKFTWRFRGRPRGILRSAHSRRRPRQEVRGAKRASDGLLLVDESACANDPARRGNVRPTSTTATAEAERRARAFRGARLTMKLSCEPEPTSMVAPPPRAVGEVRQLQRLLDATARRYG